MPALIQKRAVAGPKRGFSNGWPPAVCPSERPRPITHYRFHFHAATQTPPPTYAKDPAALKHYGHMETDVIYNSSIFKFSACTLQKRRLRGLESGHLATSSPTWLFVWSLERPPFLWQPQTPAWPPKTVLLVKKATYMPPLIQGSSKMDGPLHGPMFAQKHPYMRRCSTPPSTPPKLLHRSHECHEYPPFFLAKFAAKKSKTSTSSTP